jgi:predicted DCC family thiol-disulfide oxidoreductase YuxK
MLATSTDRPGLANIGGTNPADFGEEADYSSHYAGLNRDYHKDMLAARVAAAEPAVASAATAASLNEGCTMFFDGACPLCSKEVGFYQDLDKENRIRWLDISAAGAVPVQLEAHGITMQHAMERLHVLDEGEMKSGASAFVSLWRRLPYFKVLPPLFDHVPGVLAITEAAYCYFAKRRLTMTGREKPCSTDTCK